VDEFILRCLYRAIQTRGMASEKQSKFSYVIIKVWVLCSLLLYVGKNILI
jgi:hypothetical protein